MGLPVPPVWVTSSTTAGSVFTRGNGVAYGPLLLCWVAVPLIFQATCCVCVCLASCRTHETLADTRLRWEKAATLSPPLLMMVCIGLDWAKPCLPLAVVSRTGGGKRNCLVVLLLRMLINFGCH
jgi:hypothetical protein